MQEQELKSSVQEKNNSRMIVELDTEKFREFKIKCIQEGVSMADKIREFVNNYLKS